MKTTALIAGIFGAVVLFGCNSATTNESTHVDGGIKYPATQRNQVFDDYHGIVVADPYRWLEDDVRENAQVAKWVREQNQVTNRYLEDLPERTQIKTRMTQLWDFEKTGLPTKKGDRYFVRMNSGLQNQSPVYMTEALDADLKLVIDPNDWSEDGTVALADVNYSPKGRYIAYGIQKSGSDWRTGKILDVDSGRILKDEILGTKYGFRATWLNDESGFYYSRFPIPKTGADFQSLNLSQKVYFHKLGTPQSADWVVFENAQEPEWGFQTWLTADNRYLIIGTWHGTDDNNRLDYYDLSKLDSPTPSESLVGNFDSAWSFVHSVGSKLYFKTTLNAALGRIVAVDLGNSGPTSWEEIVPEQDMNLDRVEFVGQRFVATYLNNALSDVRLFELDGSTAGKVQLPGIGSARGFGGKTNNSETFYSFSSYTQPASVYRYDVQTGQNQVWRQPELAFDANEYTSKQVFYASKDGTRIPMIISYKKGLEFDGKNPTLIYGYGGFNISLKPRFSVANLTWMEMGGVYAVCNLRGGGEFGEKWHKAGIKQKKQNVFDDFIAGAEYLIRENYTSPENLACYGRSNGGLLVGATVNQRPDLFAAALPAVGVMDMLRFNHFTAGRYWVDDYGSSANADEFPALYAYSPYHNTGNKDYPAIMVTTADTDDRVVPGHSFKYIAAVQHDYRGDKPMLIRIESKAGHGSGKPTAKIIEEYSDMWAFIAHHTGLRLKSGYGK